METKTNYKGLIWVVVIIIIALLLGWWVLSNRNALIAWENKSYTEKYDDLTNRINVLESSKTAVVATSPASDYVIATNDEHFITVYHGETDQETINFDNAWPTYAPNDTIDWIDNSFHMGGGTFIIKHDGVISGDVWVNGKKICDDDPNTFLVIDVYVGNIVRVDSIWMAWFTSHYDKDLVVIARQTAHPTWTRQYSKLN